MSWTTPDLCDAFSERLRIAEPLFRDFGGEPKFSGSAETIKCFEDNSRIAETVATEGRGRVLVIDAGGSVRCGMFGDNLASKAIENGWAGIILWGCIRDAEVIARLPLGVKALGVHPLKSVKQGAGAMACDLHFAGIDWHPGNMIYADLNGIVVSESALPR
jgi:regulator of ribonuclease activity A